MTAIRVHNVSLDYPLVGMATRSLKNRILGAATGGLISAGASIPVVKALRDVSFSLEDGDRLALVGHNGAGKSTLLKVLAGIYEPMVGRVEIEGRVVSTLSLSLGLEPESTGVDNILTQGLLLGMGAQEIQQKLPEIIEFTELGDYIYLPVRVYSSGMATRLAFATVTAMNPDILLMDEVLGTGDAAFLQKAQARLDRFLDRSRIVVLASHSEGIVRRLCNKALLLEHGQVICLTSVDEAFDTYQQRINAAVA